MYKVPKCVNNSQLVPKCINSLFYVAKTENSLTWLYNYNRRVYHTLMKTSK